MDSFSPAHKRTRSATEHRHDSSLGFDGDRDWDESIPLAGLHSDGSPLKRDVVGQYDDPKYHPRPLATSLSTISVRILPDVLLMIGPICFAVLGFSIISIQGHVETDWTRMVISATKVAPTVWPVLFACIVGRMFKVLAHHKAQSGASLYLLEAMMQSQTMAAGFTTVFTLRLWGAFGLVLFILWSFNPIGGQASLRSATLKSSSKNNTLQLSYLNPSLYPTMEMVANNTFGSSGLDGSGAGMAMIKPMLQSLYGAALFDPTSAMQYPLVAEENDTTSNFTTLVARMGGTEAAAKASTTDLWGNIRIPVLEYLRDFNASSPEEWVETKSSREIAPYESLIGMPIKGLAVTGSAVSTFTVNTNYHLFTCSEWMNMTVPESPDARVVDPGYVAWNGSALEQWLAQNFHTLQLHYNASENKAPYYDAFTTLSSYGSSNSLGGFYLDTTTPWNGSVETRGPSRWPARELLFFSPGPNNNLWINNCTVNLSYVEARVGCNRTTQTGGTNCAVDAMRRMDQPLSTNVTFLEWASAAEDFLTAWPIIFPIEQSYTASNTEEYIADPVNAFTSNLGQRFSPTDLGTLPPDLFSKRFGLLFNTYFRTTVAPWGIVGGDFPDTVNVSSVWSYAQEPTYQLSLPWIGLYFLSTAILFVCSLVSIMVHYRTSVPDLFGYVSSFTRDSPYAQPSSGDPGSALDGMARARELRNMKLQIRDMQPEEGFGRLALTSECTLADVGRMKERKYI